MSARRGQNHFDPAMCLAPEASGLKSAASPTPSALLVKGRRHLKTRLCFLASIFAVSIPGTLSSSSRVLNLPCSSR